MAIALLCLFGIMLFSAALSVFSGAVGVWLIQRSGFLTIIFLIVTVAANFFIFMFLMKMFPIVEWMA